MSRLLALLLASATFLSAAPAGKKSVLGQVQPEIRLTDGSVFKQVRIVAYSLEQSTATLAESKRVRTVPLDQLPPKLRDQLLTEAGVKPKPADPRPRPTRPYPARPLPVPTQSPTVATPPVATSSTPQSRVQLLQLAASSAPDQLKAQLTRTYGQVGSFAPKILETAEVPGWPRIRVTGEATFTERTPGRPASSLRKEKFEIEYDTTTGVLQPATITVGGIAHPIAP
jgi:hypothetical protein